MNIRMVLSAFILAGLGIALPTNVSTITPQIAIPAGINPPSVAGFQDAIVGTSRGGRSICVSGLIAVNAATAGNVQLPATLIPNNQTAFVQQLVTAFAVGASKPATPSFDSVNQTFNIGASLCMPGNATDKVPETVEILTHGVGFDRYYWDFAPGYSYVDAAVSSGHAALMYDRLGNGMSDHPDALIVQGPLQLEIAHSLVNLLRAGSICATQFSKVIGVGHSFGSALTQGLTYSYPSLLDAAVLTGYGVNSTLESTVGFDFGGNPAIASLADPQRFAGLSNGYLCAQTATGVQIQFFSYPGFDPSILAQAQDQAGTQTIGEMMSGPIGGPAINYTAPLFVANGMNDFPFCLGNCSYPSNQAELVSKLYPGVKPGDFGAYLAMNAGHGLNLHFSAYAAYQAIQQFLLQHGF